jgi:hypothetical protein
MVACVFYINWSAERNAFCDAIEIGSDISVATQKAKDSRSRDSRELEGALVGGAKAHAVSFGLLHCMVHAQ